MVLLSLPLLMAGFALGGLVYAGIALSLARAAISLWRAVAGISCRRVRRADATDIDRRVGQLHRIGEAERSLRSAA